MSCRDSTIQKWLKGSLVHPPTFRILLHIRKPAAAKTRKESKKKQCIFERTTTLSSTSIFTIFSFVLECSENFCWVIFVSYIAWFILVQYLFAKGLKFVSCCSLKEPWGCFVIVSKLLFVILRVLFVWVSLSREFVLELVCLWAVCKLKSFCKRNILIVEISSC